MSIGNDPATKTPHKATNLRKASSPAKIFKSRASKPSGVTALAGTLTGSTDGTIADVADIALSTSDTYTDAAVNAAVNGAVLDLNLQLKELQTKMNAILAALKK